MNLKLCVPNEKDIQPPFSISEYYSKLLVDSRWEYFKQFGDNALKQNNIHDAINYYSDGIFVALHLQFNVLLFSNIQFNGHTTCAWQQVRDSSDIMSLIKSYVIPTDNKILYSYRYPNLPAAICYARRCSAYLLLTENIEKINKTKLQINITALRSFALRDALNSMILCCELEEGRDQLLAYYKHINDTNMQSILVTEKERFHKLQLTSPCTGMSLCMMGYITPLEYIAVYEPPRREVIKRHLKTLPDWQFWLKASVGKIFFEQSCSQRRYLTVDIFLEGSGNVGVGAYMLADCGEFIGDDEFQPLSPESLSMAFSALRHCLVDLQDIDITSLALGVGLVRHYEDLRMYLATTSEGVGAEGGSVKPGVDISPLFNIL